MRSTLSLPGDRARSRGRSALVTAAAMLVALTAAVVAGMSMPGTDAGAGRAGVPSDLGPVGGADGARSTLEAARDRAAPGTADGVEVVGYVPYYAQPPAVMDAIAQRGLFSTASPWWYSPTIDGGVVEQHPEYTDTGDDVVAALRDSGLRVMPTIANHRDGVWDFEVVPALLADDAARRRHVRELVDLAERRGYDGIVIDYEFLGADDRDDFTAFVTALGDALHAADKRLAVALHAQTTDEGVGEHNLAQDYRALGRAADELHLMTFNFHYDESLPGPIAPLPWVSDVVDYAVSRVPAHKIVLGIGLFGYDWHGAGPADGLQLDQVRTRIARRDAAPSWDAEAAAPWVRYDVDGVRHELWYENARSVAAKLDLVRRHGLGGAFFWRLGAVPDDIWQASRGELRTP